LQATLTLVVKKLRNFMVLLLKTTALHLTEHQQMVKLLLIQELMETTLTLLLFLMKLA
jgi:hypothetical protein